MKKLSNYFTIDNIANFGVCTIMVCTALFLIYLLYQFFNM